MKVKIGFAGDFCPWMRTEEVYKSGDWKKMFDSVKPFFDENDLNVIDLECPLIDSPSPIKKTGPHIHAVPATAAILRYLNCSLAATANNHLMDHGVAGLYRTYKALEENNISWVGSGMNFKEASKICYRKIGNTRFAIINTAENEWATTEDESPGCNPLDPVNVFNQVSEAKGQADHIIVVAHGGHEHFELPSPRMKKLYRFFVDAGADAVISHHTHIVSGYEIYNGKPIFYSLGNFCFDWPGMQGKPWNYGMIVRLVFENNKISFEMNFIEQCNAEAGVKLLGKTESEKKIIEIKKLNNLIADDNALKESFDKYCESQKDLLLTWIQPYHGKIMAGLYKRKMLPHLMGKKKKRLFTNLMRCEAHRDVLLYALQSDIK